MQKENKSAVLNNECHSRKSLSGIYNACRYTRKPQTMCVEDPRLQASGMTTLLNNTPSSVPTGRLSPHGEVTHFNAPSTWRERVAGGRVGGKFSRGFTLIELLVVVLIIGILAAVALPQYQKAVERGRATQWVSMFESYKKAMNLYVLEHGYQDVSFWGEGTEEKPREDLIIDFPAEQTTKIMNYYCNDTCLFDPEIACASSGYCKFVLVSPRLEFEARMESETGAWRITTCGFTDSKGKAVCNFLGK